MKKDGNGFKFLNPYGATEYNGIETVYPLPRPDEKWGPWFEHPSPAEPDGLDCGPGRWHVMKCLDATYAPARWYPWFAEYAGVIGEGFDKVGVRAIRLRVMRKEVFWKIIRLGHCAGLNLAGADLTSANLVCADLVRTNLYRADLTNANLAYANLTYADLAGANLAGANLDSANLAGANLSHANLAHASLDNANLDNASLAHAYLFYTCLFHANLTGVDLTGAEVTREQLDAGIGFFDKGVR